MYFKRPAGRNSDIATIGAPGRANATAHGQFTGMDEMRRDTIVGPNAQPFLRASATVAGAALIILASASAAFASPDPRGPGTEPMTSSPERFDDRQVVLITGSTGGLGREVARRMAASGAHVIVHGRNQQRGDELVAEIERDGRGSARFYAADLGSLDEVRALGERIQRDYDRLDVLVNNAGIWINDANRQLSEDGHELHFAVNYLSGVLLTRMLLPLLVESAPARIVNVASGAQRPIDFEDVMLERDYSGSRAYAQSKLAQILFTVDLAAELEGTGVTSYSLHPATLMDTDMVAGAGMQPRSTVEEGADAVMNLITGTGLENGGYFNGLTPARANAQAYDADARARLRRLTDELIGPVGAQPTGS